MPGNRIAGIAAVIALCLAGLSAAAMSSGAAAAEDTEFVCYDMPNPDPDEGLVCMTLSDFKAECAEGSGLEECDLIEDGETVVIGGLMGTRPQPQVPQSLVGGSDSEPASGRPGGGFIILSR